MSRVASLIGAFALCLVPALLPAANPEPTVPAVKVEKNITFSTVGNEKLALDIAIPPGDGPFPCVVMLYGGAWTGGSRKHLSVGDKDKDGNVSPSWIEAAATRGYVAVAPSYRLAPKHKFPAMIEDARAAVRFLRANSKAYKIDSDKFGSLGFSAGGHLALLLGLCDKSAGFDVGDNLEESCAVQCVVDFYGPTDLSLYAATSGIEDAYIVPVFGKDVKTDPKVYQKASPISYVTKNAPPILIMHGTFDLIVPIKHSESLHKLLTDAKTTTEIITFPFAGHGGWSGKEMTKATTAAFKFLDTHLKGKK